MSCRKEGEKGVTKEPLFDQDRELGLMDCRSRASIVSEDESLSRDVAEVLRRYDQIEG